MVDTMGKEEAAIRDLLEAKVAATRSKDASAATAAFAPDVVSFDVVDPLRHSGVDVVKSRAATWFSTFRGSIDFAIHDLQVVVGDNVAFAYGLSHAVGELIAGGRLDMWWRGTIGLQKRQGRWWITHTHDSVPFSPESGKPSLTLKP